MIPLRNANSSIELSRKPPKGIIKRKNSKDCGRSTRSSKSTKSRNPKNLKDLINTPSSSIAEKLLKDISEKYDATKIRESCYISRLDRKTMVHEIKMLAQLLISNEKTLK